MNKYRFGYNTQEKDDEVYGKGNLNSAEFWMYDTRLGRRWNLDPVYKESISNYSAFSNNPILYLDVNGDDSVSSTKVAIAQTLYLFAELFKTVEEVTRPPWSEEPKDGLEVMQNVVDRAMILYTPVGIGKSIPINKTGNMKNNSFNKLVSNSTKVSDDVMRITVKYRTPQIGPQFVKHSTYVSNGRVNIASRMVTNGNFDFVVTQEGKIILGKGHFHLSGGAESVKAAGQVSIYKGKITNINNNSGHYKPTIEEAKKFESVLKDAGVDLSGATLNIYDLNGVKVEKTKLQ